MTNASPSRGSRWARAVAIALLLIVLGWAVVVQARTNRLDDATLARELDGYRSTIDEAAMFAKAVGDGDGWHGATRVYAGNLADDLDNAATKLQTTDVDPDRRMQVLRASDTIARAATAIRTLKLHPDDEQRASRVAHDLSQMADQVEAAEHAPEHQSGAGA